MDAACHAERTRLIREATGRADAERRRWSFTLQLVLALLLFGLAPLVPRGHHLFGELSAPLALAIVSPGALMAVVSLVAYRRFGPDSSVYRASDVLETLLHYAVNVGTAYATKLTWPVLWILCPFTAVFFAVTKPFAGRLHTWVMGTAHVSIALLYVARGEAHGAWIALVVGAASYALYLVLARHGRRSLSAEAERNVAQARLDAACLDDARRRIATTLRDGIGREITELARELDDEGALHARAAASELVEIAEPTTPTGPPCTLSDVMVRIDEKCRPLCSEASYEGSVAADGNCDRHELLFDAASATAFVRVAQELVRNAVVHGGATRVRVNLGIDADAHAVTLRVADDGSGLSPGHLAYATGGLDSAARWLREHGGTLVLLDRPGSRGGTTLEAKLPRTLPHVVSSSG